MEEKSKSLWKLITKNDKTKGISLLIAAVIGIYISAILFYLCTKTSGLAEVLLAVTSLMVIAGIIISIYIGCNMLSDYYNWDL